MQNFEKSHFLCAFFLLVHLIGKLYTLAIRVCWIMLHLVWHGVRNIISRLDLRFEFVSILGFSCIRLRIYHLDRHCIRVDWDLIVLHHVILLRNLIVILKVIVAVWSITNQALVDEIVSNIKVMLRHYLRLDAFNCLNTIEVYCCSVADLIQEVGAIWLSLPQQFCKFNLGSWSF